MKARPMNTMYNPTWQRGKKGKEDDGKKMTEGA
jgi:hypothetical protein